MSNKKSSYGKRAFSVAAPTLVELSPNGIKNIHVD